MPLKARQRSRLAVLAVLALVGSLLAVSAVPAVAAGDEKVTSPADYSACVAAATEDAGFTDMAGNFAADEANCLAHYGITVGTSAGVFSPNDSISRAQMALFMVRAATVAGVELDDPEDQGLGDIGNWTDAIQDGINQAVAAGIMSGHDNAFNPSGAVSRQDMAVILDNLLNVAEIDSLNDDGNVLDGEGDEVTVDTPFDDLAMVPFEAYDAINNLYELGVASGTGDGSTFTPSALVSRAQMAVFVTRALDHTNARPAGISMQSMPDSLTTVGEEHDFQVSVRDGDHQPVADAIVEVFSSTMPDEAWNDDGTCFENQNIREGAGGCVIGNDDPATEPDGNATASVTLPADPGNLTVWAWTGESGDEFNIDEDDSVSAVIDVMLGRESTLISDDTKTHASNLKFGDKVTYTVQIADKNDDPVASDGEEVTIRSVIADTTDGDSPGDGAKRDDTRTSVDTKTTDANGRFTVSYTSDDPSDDDGDMITLTLTITGQSDFKLMANDPGEDSEDDLATSVTIVISWSDADPEPTSLHLSQAMSYHLANDDGVRNTVRATLVDQYGDPVRNEKVAFWSDVDNPGTGGSLGLGGGETDDDDDNGPEAGTGTNAADHRTTSRSGVATKSYTRGATAAGNESLDAVYTVTVAGECLDSRSDCTESDDTIKVEADAITHYWATGPVSAGETFTTQTVLVVDTDNNTIIIGDAGTPRLVTYKAGDQFRDGTDPITLDVFEDRLSADDPDTSDNEADSITVVMGDDDDDINSFTITTNN